MKSSTEVSARGACAAVVVGGAVGEGAGGAQGEEEEERAEEAGHSREGADEKCGEVRSEGEVGELL